MCGRLLPRQHIPDRPLACGSQPGGTADLLTRAIHPHGQLVIVLDGELDITTAPGLARRLEPLAEAGSHPIAGLAAPRRPRARFLPDSEPVPHWQYEPLGQREGTTDRRA